MARTINSGSSNNYSEYERIMVDNFNREFDRPVYCQICGQPLIMTGGGGNPDGLSKDSLARTPEKYDPAMRGNVHQDCYNRHTAEQQRKAAAEAERKRIEDIQKAREEEDKKNGGQ